MDKDLTHDEVMEQWETLRQSILDCWEIITEVLVPVFRQSMDAICAFVVQLRRFQLQFDLVHRWRMSSRFAYWLSDKWPERWLPELRFVE